jgi:hypothetical protein
MILVCAGRCDLGANLGAIGECVGSILLLA